MASGGNEQELRSCEKSLPTSKRATPREHLESLLSRALALGVIDQREQSSLSDLPVHQIQEKIDLIRGSMPSRSSKTYVLAMAFTSEGLTILERIDEVSTNTPLFIAIIVLSVYCFCFDLEFEPVHLRW